MHEVEKQLSVLISGDGLFYNSVHNSLLNSCFFTIVIVLVYNTLLNSCLLESGCVSIFGQNHFDESVNQ